jgi:predicted nucleic-acid-binding protein
MKTVAVDTNLLIRLFAKDDSAQWRIVSNLFATHRVVILATVILETEWVLRKTIGFDKAMITGIFRSMLVSETIVVPERERLLRALEAFDAGMDFADAFHVSGVETGGTFVSFDRDLVRRAGKHFSHLTVELAQ